ncbi:MAG: pyruvate kinase alpha/beta domain-containing protein [Thermodesulfobacteriota bacterium]
MEGKIVYFEKTGAENTETTLRIVKKRAEELGIKMIVVASTTGSVALKAVEILKGLKVIFVSHSAGFREPNVQRFSEESRKIVESKGGTILTATHVFAGLSTALRNKTNTVTIGDMVAHTLRIFGAGTKVACEISMMAADAGLVRTDENIVSVGGTGQGCDTALVLTPVTSQNFFDLRIKEILCKPHF